MSDTEKNLQIKITTPYDGTGAKQAGSDMEKLGGAQKNLNLTTTEATDVAREHGAAQREIFRVTSELNRVVPGLGEAMRAAFEPDSINIVGALIAIEAFKSVLEDMSALDSVQQAHFTGDKEAIDAVKDAYEKITVAVQIFNEEIIRQNGEGISAENLAKRQMENYKNLAKAQEDYNSAQKKLGESQIDANERTGVISHQQALEQKFALDVQYAQKKLQLDAQMAAAELSAKQQQLATEQQQLAALQSDQATDEANAKAAEGTQKKHEKQRSAAQKNIDDAQKTLDELGKSHGTLIPGQINDETVQQLKEYYQKYVGGNTETTSLSDQFLQLQQKQKTITDSASWDLGLTNLLDRTIGSQAGPAALEKYQGAKNQIADSTKELNSLDKTQFDVDLNAERGKKQLDATDDSIRTLSKSVADLSLEIPRLKADNAAKENNAAGVANITLRADAIDKGLADPGNVFKSSNAPVATTAQPVQATSTSAAPAAAPTPYAQTDDGQARKDWSQIEEAAKILGHGGKLDDQQTNLLKEILDAATGHVVKNDHILATIKDINDNQSKQNEAFEKLRQQVAQNRNAINMAQ